MNPRQDPFKTPLEVHEWCEQMTRSGRCPEYEEWPKQLFGLGKNSYSETIDFLIARFRTTSNMMEYYFCIPYLFKDIEKDVLFTPWHKTPNFQRLSEGDIKTCPETNLSNGGRQGASDKQSKHFNRLTQGWW